MSANASVVSFSALVLHSLSVQTLHAHVGRQLVVLDDEDVVHHDMQLSADGVRSNYCQNRLANVSHTGVCLSLPQAEVLQVQQGVARGGSVGKITKHKILVFPASEVTMRTREPSPRKVFYTFRTAFGSSIRVGRRGNG